MGSFNNRARAAQLIDFEGLKWDKCGCTDIDLSLDWQGRTFIFVEIKTEGTMLTLGQKYHLQALVRAIRAGGRVAFAILAHHNTVVTEDVYAAQCRTAKVFDGIKWNIVDTNEQLSATIDIMYQEHQREDKAA